jgi:glycosyltransferase involved in cell wall biosynthesis
VDQRFKRCPAGKIWTYTPPSYAFFDAALTVFDKVRVIARTSDVAEAPHNARLVTGPRVELVPVPSYVGPIEYMQRCRSILRALEECAALDGCFLFRIPSQLAFVLSRELEKLQRPYAVELLTDPHAFFAPGVAPHGLAFLFRPYFRRRSRELCARAVAVNYVTGSLTRAANPPGAGAWSDSLSDVELPGEAFLDLQAQHRESPAPGKPIRIVSVGFLDLLYKGQDVLIKAVARCRERGLDFDLTFVGDGQQRGNLLSLAASLQVADRVHITGALGGPAQVRDELAKAHVFSLPSRAEGIPRALLEAMAAGLPAICSRVGAMADLLETRWVVEPNSVEDLSAKLVDFAAAPGQWSAIGARNQQAVRSYEASQLAPRRVEFYRAIRELTRGAVSRSAWSSELHYAA